MRETRQTAEGLSPQVLADYLRTMPLTVRQASQEAEHYQMNFRTMTAPFSDEYDSGHPRQQLQRSEVLNSCLFNPNKAFANTAAQLALLYRDRTVAVGNKRVFSYFAEGHDDTAFVLTHDMVDTSVTVGMTGPGIRPTEATLWGDRFTVQQGGEVLTRARREEVLAKLFFESFRSGLKRAELLEQWRDLAAMQDRQALRYLAGTGATR